MRKVKPSYFGRTAALGKSKQLNLRAVQGCFISGEL